MELCDYCDEKKATEWIIYCVGNAPAHLCEDCAKEFKNE